MYRKWYFEDKEFALTRRSSPFLGGPPAPSGSLLVPEVKGVYRKTA
jgi:hypothetical protein